MSATALSTELETADVLVPHPLWRISIERYHRMLETGVLTADDRVELIEGLLVAKMNKSPRHCAASRLVRLALERVIPSGWFVDAQDPITLADSEPEPDVTVTVADRGKLLDRHPGPDEVGLVVEIADSSLRTDRDTKRRIYARAGIPVYWVVNLIDSNIEVDAVPGDSDDYAQYDQYRTGDEVPVVLDGQQIARIPADAMLPG